jgi:hypothetical protein
VLVIVELGYESRELLLGGYFCEKKRVKTNAKPSTLSAMFLILWQQPHADWINDSKQNPQPLTNCHRS